MSLRMWTGPVKPVARPLPHGNNQQSPAVQSLIGTVYGGFGSAPRQTRSLGRRNGAGARRNAAAASRSRKARVSYGKSARKAAGSKGRASPNRRRLRANGKRRSSARNTGRLVAGSAAAKRYMAKIRRMRK